VVARNAHKAPEEVSLSDLVRDTAMAVGAVTYSVAAATAVGREVRRLRTMLSDVLRELAERPLQSPAAADPRATRFLSPDDGDAPRQLLSPPALLQRRGVAFYGDQAVRTSRPPPLQVVREAERELEAAAAGRAPAARPRLRARSPSPLPARSRSGSPIGSFSSAASASSPSSPSSSSSFMHSRSRSPTPMPPQLLRPPRPAQTHTGKPRSAIRSTKLKQAKRPKFKAAMRTVPRAWDSPPPLPDLPAAGLGHWRRAPPRRSAAAATAAALGRQAWDAPKEDDQAMAATVASAAWQQETTVGDDGMPVFFAAPAPLGLVARPSSFSVVAAAAAAAAAAAVPGVGEPADVPRIERERVDMEDAPIRQSEGPAADGDTGDPAAPHSGCVRGSLCPRHTGAHMCDLTMSPVNGAAGGALSLSLCATRLFLLLVCVWARGTQVGVCGGGGEAGGAGARGVVALWRQRQAVAAGRGARAGRDGQCRLYQDYPGQVRACVHGHTG
jgi:hypothetical protein